MLNYDGRRFDVIDTLGQIYKDGNGEIMPLTDKKGNLLDK